MAATLPYWGVQGVLAEIRHPPHTEQNVKTVNFRDPAKLFEMSATASLTAISEVAATQQIFDPENPTPEDPR